MAEEKLKVSDLVSGFTDKEYREINELIKTLWALSNRYQSMAEINNVEELEKIKREFNGHMQRFSTLFASVKKYKDSNFQYLGEHRKRFKAAAVKRLLDEGKNATNANNLVYDSEYYVERVELMEDLVGFFTKVDLFYNQCEDTFRAIIQSISIASKELESSKAAG